MVTSGWKEAGPVLRVVWKFASMENGGLCVMTHGMMTIPVWSVDSLVSHEVVRRSLNSCQLHASPIFTLTQLIPARLGPRTACFRKVRVSQYHRLFYHIMDMVKESF